MIFHSFRAARGSSNVLVIGLDKKAAYGAMKFRMKDSYLKAVPMQSHKLACYLPPSRGLCHLQDRFPCLISRRYGCILFKLNSRPSCCLLTFFYGMDSLQVL